jgi:AcrR family transcriptional regulator
MTGLMMDNIEDMQASPAERRRQKVRSSILEAAERVFSDAGEDGLSIRRLAEEIDYSPAAIYKYFGSKEELLDELKEAFFERLLAQVDTVQDCGEPFLVRARMAIETYIRTALEKPHHYAAAFSAVDAGALPDAGAPPCNLWEEFISSRKGQAFSYLVEIVEQGQELGVFRADLQPVLAAKSIWVSSHGLAQLMIHMPSLPVLLPDGQGQSTDDFIAFHCDLVIRSLEIASPSISHSKTNGARHA